MYMYLRLLSALSFSHRFIFEDCRTGQCKNNVQYIYVGIFADIFFAESSFSLAKMNRFTVYRSLKLSNAKYRHVMNINIVP